jgi:hypothetical protein
MRTAIATVTIAMVMLTIAMLVVTIAVFMLCHRDLGVAIAILASRTR